MGSNARASDEESKSARTERLEEKREFNERRSVASLKIVFFVLLLSLMSCTTHIVPPRLETPRAATAIDYQPWAQVLQQVVDAEGRIDFKTTQEDPAELEEFVRTVAQVSPKSNPELFPENADVLSYYINSYNALALYGVIRSGIPHDFDSTVKQADFFVFTTFLVGGEEISLYDYENEVIRPYSVGVDAERVHFALNCMARGCPRLPQEPFGPDRLEGQLNDAAFEFFSSEKHIRIDHQKKTVYLSKILDFYTEDFIRPNRPTLIDYANLYRKESDMIPSGYEIDFIPYDWTVNSQE